MKIAASWMCGAILAAGMTLGGCGHKPADAGNGGGADAAEAGGSATAGAAATDPCGFLTPDEVTAITTDKVNGTQVQDGKTCKYSSNPSDDGITVTVYPSGGRHQMDIARKSANLLGGLGGSVAGVGGAGKDVAAQLKPSGDQPPAIGDEAMWEANTTLAVRKGDAFVEVGTPIMHDPASHSGYPLVSKEEKQKIAIAVATKVLAKL